MDEAEHCDRIAIIDHGHIVALDTPAALKQRVGKDMVTARGADPEALARSSRQVRHRRVTRNDGGLSFLVAEGDAFIVKLLTARSAGAGGDQRPPPDAGRRLPRR